MSQPKQQGRKKDRKNELQDKRNINNSAKKKHMTSATEMYRQAYNKKVSWVKVAACVSVFGLSIGVTHTHTHTANEWTRGFLSTQAGTQLPDDRMEF